MHTSSRFSRLGVILAAVGLLAFLAPAPVTAQCVDPPRNMVGWWTLDESGGTFASDSALTNHGTVMGGGTFGLGHVAGALDLDGVDDHVRIPTDPSLNFGQFENLSIDAWIRPRTVQGLPVIAEKRTGPEGPGVVGFSFFLFNGDLAFQISHGSSFTTFISTLPVPADVWSHVAVVVRRTEGIRLFVNGESQSFALNVTPADISNSADLTLGVPSQGFNIPDPFDGWLDEVEIFNRALSDREVFGIFQAGRLGKCKITMDVPWDTYVCAEDDRVFPEIRICNRGVESELYRLELAGLPEGHLGLCNAEGPSQFVPTPPIPIRVGPGTCIARRIAIPRPPSLNESGKVACWEARLVDLEDTVILADHGTLRDRRSYCVRTPRSVSGVGPSGSVAGFEITDVQVAQDLAFEIQAFEPGMVPDTEIISVNGLPPGEPLTGTLSLRPGEATRLEVDLSATAQGPSDFFDLLLSADVDGNGEMEALSSVSLLPTATDCLDGLDALCLTEERFKVQVEWTDFQGGSGIGQAVPLTTDTGYFWFFDDANVELVLKVLDARAINQHFWVFYGALSNVEYTITVTDLALDRVKQYVNPPGQFASVGDTRAFPQAERLEIPTAGPMRDVSMPMHVDREAFGTGTGVLDSGATGTCTPDATHLCLTEDRFRVSVEWEDFQGNTGVGQAIPITTDTGYFWFFDDANVELVLKVLDGRVINNNFWVFYGALSNVEYTITVTDTVTGDEKQYINPSGNFGSVGDTAAF